MDVDPALLFTFHSSLMIRGHYFRIFKSHADVYHNTSYFFSLRIINGWNGLSEDPVNADSIDIFETYLDRSYYDHQCKIVIVGFGCLNQVSAFLPVPQ